MIDPATRRLGDARIGRMGEGEKSRRGDTGTEGRGTNDRHCELAIVIANWLVCEAISSK